MFGLSKKIADLRTRIDNLIGQPKGYGYSYNQTLFGLDARLRELENAVGVKYGTATLVWGGGDNRLDDNRPSMPANQAIQLILDHLGLEISTTDAVPAKTVLVKRKK
jgi:hypothetical protein